jgi:hypothetical protein
MFVCVSSLPSPVSAILYCIHPNGYLVDAQPGGGVFSGHHPDPLRLPTLFHVLGTAVEAQMRFLHPQLLVLGPNYPSIDLVAR